MTRAGLVPWSMRGKLNWWQPAQKPGEPKSGRTSVSWGEPGARRVASMLPAAQVAGRAAHPLVGQRPPPARTSASCSRSGAWQCTHHSSGCSRYSRWKMALVKARPWRLAAHSPWAAG